MDSTSTTKGTKSKQMLISDYFLQNNQKVYGYNEKTNSWYCIECYDDTCS